MANLDAAAIVAEQLAKAKAHNWPIVLSVDPGLSRCGVAVLTGTASRPMLLASDVIRTTAHDDHSQRLAMIHTGICRMADRFEPNVLAVERIFINKQANTGIGAVQVVGFVHLVGAYREVPVVEYTPSQVKLAVTGSGDADKQAVAHMVMRTLKLAEKPTPADRADAMAVGICHISQPAYVHLQPQLNKGSNLVHGRVAGNTKRNTGISPRLAAMIEQSPNGLAKVARS